MLVFPGLEAANIGSKLVESASRARRRRGRYCRLREAGQRPVARRGVEDIVGSIAMVVVRGQQA